MLPVETGEVVLQYGPDAAPTILAGGEPGNASAGYIPVDPGRYKLRAICTAAPAPPLETLDLDVAAGAYITILAQQRRGVPSIEVIEDTYDRALATTGRLTIHHFLANAEISMRAGSRKAGPLVRGAVEVLDGLPRGVLILQMTARMNDGRIREWSMEVDLRSCPRVAVLLLLDSYGRFRPRLSPCGQMELGEPESSD